MAHLIEENTPEKNKKNRFTFTLPKLEGKFGFSFYLGKKEIFIGLAVAGVEMEKIVRQRKVKVLPKGKAFVLPIP